MPFKSEKQRRYMWKFHPRTAKRWSREGRNRNLPKYRRKRKRRQR